MGRITSVVTTSTHGNVLDVAVDTEVARIFVSLDTFHVPGSTKEVLPSSQDVQPFQVFEFRQEAGGVVPEHREQPMWVEQGSTVLNSTGSSEMQTMADADANVAEGSDQKKRGGARQTLSEFLYGLENLRKRRGFASAEDDDPARSGSRSRSRGDTREPVTTPPGLFPPSALPPLTTSPEVGCTEARYI